MIERQYLDDCVLQLGKLKSLAERAIAQIDNEPSSSPSSTPRPTASPSS